MSKKFKCYKCGKIHVTFSRIGILHGLSQKHKDGLKLAEFKQWRDGKKAIIKKIRDEDESDAVMKEMYK